MPGRVHMSCEFQGDVYKFLHLFIPAPTTQHSTTYSVSPKRNTPTKGCPRRERDPGCRGRSLYMANPGTWQGLEAGSEHAGFSPTHPHWLLTSMAPCSTLGIP